MVDNAIAVQAIYGASTVFSAALAVVLWRARESRGALPLCMAVFGVCLWGLATLLQTLVGEFWSRQFNSLSFVGIVMAPAATFVFALEYTGRERFITKKVLAALSIHPVLTVFAVVVNPGNYFYADFVEAPDRAVGYQGESAILFDIHTLYSYLLIFAAAALILEFVIKKKHELYFGQASTLVIGVLSPVLFNAIFLLGFVNFDATLVGFFVTFSMFSLAIVEYQLTDLAPIAREKVIGSVRDGMFVTDTDGIIADSNPAARQLTNLEDQQAVGVQFMTLVSHYPDLVDAYEKLTETAEAGQQTVSYGGRYVTVEVSPIFDDHGRHIGWVVLLHDITEQKQRERDLEEQIEKLDQFAGVVSHDLRNPINVARGYVQHSLATGDVEHLEKTEDAFDRMEAIIEDVLALAREGQAVTDPTEVSLATTAHDAWSTVDTGEATLEVADDATIVADETRVQRLFENLFRNALEHGLADDQESAALTVTVGVADSSGSEMTVYVADNGTGIPDDKLDEVLEGGFTTNPEGTGLGLSIVEQIASAHGWTVTVDHSEDGGARFEFAGVDQVPTPTPD